MKESYKEDLANHFGLELYADDGNVMGVATTGGKSNGSNLFVCVFEIKWVKPLCLRF